MVSFYEGSHTRVCTLHRKEWNARNKVVSITRVFCVQYGWYRGCNLLVIFAPEYGLSYSGAFLILKPNKRS